MSQAASKGPFGESVKDCDYQCLDWKSRDLYFNRSFLIKKLKKK